jgi:hypothetical protein
MISFYEHGTVGLTAPLAPLKELRWLYIKEQMTLQRFPKSQAIAMAFYFCPSVSIV